MQYRKLGSSDLEVSEICLGTMTWGRQNNQAEADEQMDYALSKGVNFWDTAEMYAVPPNKSTYGTTETIIGNWFNANPSKRQEVILMTKIAGSGLSYIRNGKGYTGKDILSSIDASLKRLQTDYIDVYQLHWPNRPHPNFGRHWFNRIDFEKVNIQQQEEEIIGILEALDKAIKAGKIRYCGLSNESAWGISKYIELSKKHDLPRMISVQNEFSLIQSKDYPTTIEACVLEDLAYLPWSPLGAGVLSGKYLNGQRPAGSRWTMVNRHGNFRDTEAVHQAVAAYAEIAKKHNITPSQLALVWCLQFKWVTAPIIGATNMTQLKENIAAAKIHLDKAALKEIDAVKRAFPAPF